MGNRLARLGQGDTGRVGDAPAVDQTHDANATRWPANAVNAENCILHGTLGSACCVVAVFPNRRRVDVITARGHHRAVKTLDYS